MGVEAGKVTVVSGQDMVPGPKGVRNAQILRILKAESGFSSRADVECVCQESLPEFCSEDL